MIGDAGLATPLNKVLIDTTNDNIEFYIEVSSSSVQQLYIADGLFTPVTNNDIDLGTSSQKFKDFYLDGVAYRCYQSITHNLQQQLRLIYLMELLQQQPS